MEGIDLRAMFFGDLQWSTVVEIFIRAIIMYGYTIVLFRFVLGIRGISELSPYEYIIIIALGSALGDPMANPDMPLATGLLVVTLLVLMDKGLVLLTNRFPGLEARLEGEPARLVMNGRLDTDGLQKANLSRDEIFAYLREKGVEQLGQVKRAYLEINGRVSVFLYPKENVRPGLAIMPPPELVHKNAADDLRGITPGNEPVRACSHCGFTRPGTATDEGEACPECGSKRWQTAIITVDEVVDPATN